MQLYSLRSVGPIRITAWPRSQFFLISVISLCIAFSGCRGEQEESASPSPAPVAEKSAPVPVPQSHPEETAQVKKKRAKPKFTSDDLDNLYDASTAENYALMDFGEQRDWKRAHEATAAIPSHGKGASQFIASIQSEPPAAVAQIIVDLPENFSAIPEAGYSRGGYPNKILCDLDQSVMVLIPGGVFIQGKDGAEKNVAPEHSMYLDSYYIDEHEVTIAAYNAYRKYEISLEKKGPQRLSNEHDDPQMPALGMPWRDAAGYASYTGKELPTEAEWEKAARGNGGFDHPWGFGRPAWHRLRKPNQISPVKSYPTDKSPFGVFDMAGNAMEWCSDWYRADAYQKLADEFDGVPRNWKGPRTAEPNSHHVVKGNNSDWLLWHRQGYSLSTRDPRIGFRCVLRMESSEDE